MIADRFKDRIAETVRIFFPCIDGNSLVKALQNADWQMFRTLKSVKLVRRKSHKQPMKMPTTVFVVFGYQKVFDRQLSSFFLRKFS